MATVTKLSNYILRFRNILLSELPDVCRLRLKQKKDELIELIRNKSDKIQQSEFARKMRIAKGYYQLEMAPPKVNEMRRLVEDITLVKAFIETGSFKHLTVRQACLLFLVSTEVGLWFFLGETIGKMHIVGYKV